METFEKKDLKKKDENISDWYTDIIQKAEIAEYGPVRGTMVIRPYGYAIWERVQEVLGGMIKAAGVSNAYFPLFIPYSLLSKEKDHVKGFSPELALVTKAGGEDLVDPLVIRPTSETIMYEMYAKWIKSWRDLPLKINQWNNAVRWEKRTLVFLRTSEFLWQEGHCAHETDEENQKMVLQALDWYRQVYEDYYAIPVITGIKSNAERFAGAVSTYCVEALMPDGKALQGATSHNLGQNFSKAQKITFQDKAGKTQYVWQNSWGFSTRTLGALFMVHGDNDGLVLPPKVAPIKVVIIPILGKKDEEILRYSEKVKSEIEKAKSKYPGEVVILSDSEQSFGRRISEAEIKGIPLIISIGKREVEEKTVTIKYRLAEMGQSLARISDVSNKADEMLTLLQDTIFQNAKADLSKNTTDVTTYDQFRKIMESKRGFIKAFWCEDPDCETKIKAETKATTRVKPLDAKQESGKCIYCGRKANYIWYFAQAY